jgi:(p)ppGpp synthase/HD superfamily hydrolase
MAYSPRFEDALGYAYRLHARQQRKGSGAPYVTHLLAVAALVGENGGDDEQMMAALLHDAVEDQGGLPQLEAIRHRFGERVAAIVRSCSDSFDTPKPPWRERKEAHLTHLETAEPSVLLVALADKVHNARSIVADLRQHGIAALDKFKGGRDGTLWYYPALVSIFDRRGLQVLAGELHRIVDEMLRLADARW